MSSSVNLLKENAENKYVNPWFQKSALILTLNSRINIQKSFWRFKYNSQTTGIT